jgi:hypothetical protein
MTTFDEWFYVPGAVGRKFSRADWFREEFEDLPDEVLNRIMDTWLKMAYESGLENSK